MEERNQFTPDGAGPFTREEAEAYYEANREALDAIVAAREAAARAEVIPVEMAKVFDRAQAMAVSYLNQLKGRVHPALVAGGMSEAEATAAGVALVLRHAAPLAAFEAAGGHPVAAEALYQAISSPESVAALPWLTAPILAIFRQALAPG